MEDVRQLSAQEIFEKAATHLLKQGVKSTDDGRCRYRGPDNTMCAVGALIPDNAYDPDFEGISVKSLDPTDDFHQSLECRGRMAKLKKAMHAGGVDPVEHNNLLSALQGTHDCRSPHGWHRRLVEIGKDRNLSTTCLEVAL